MPRIVISPGTMRLIRFAVFFLVLLLQACSRNQAPKPDVILLHTGRLNGNVYPLSLQSISPLQHYPYLAGYIAQVRKEAAQSGAQVFVVDLGDSLCGSFASHVTGSENMVTFFNTVGYDAIILSNLDANVPEAALSKLKCKVLSPFVAPDGAGSLPPAGGRFQEGDIPLFLLANFYGDTDPASQPQRFPAKFGALSSGVRPVRDYSPTLKALGPRPEGSLTMMSWMKFEPAATPPEPMLERLRGLDVNVILAHRIYEKNEREAWQSRGFVDWRPPVSLNILRNNGGFALARMDLAREGKDWRVVRHELIPMTANNAAPDPAVVGVIESFADPIRKADSPLYDLPEPLGAARILDIYMAALTTVPGTQAVAYSQESIRSDWSKGPLRASAVFNSLPWTTALVQLTLSAGQLQDLAHSARFRVVALQPIPDGDIRVTSSRFFAQLIASQPGFEGTAITEIPATNEFDFFLSYLKANPSAVSEGLPIGWSAIGRP